MKALYYFGLYLFLLITSYPQQISLQGNLFSGYEYSIDSTNYESVGSGADGLYPIMKDNEECLADLDSYKTYKTLALVSSIPGGFLIGWPIGGAIGGGEWKDSYSIMLGVGGALTILAIVFERKAGSNLEAAVERYNSGLSPSASSSLKDIFAKEQIEFGIKIKF